MYDQKKPPFVGQALFKASEIKQIERVAAKSGAYPLYHLMEKAGLAAWEYIQKHWAEAQNITLVCGNGNNAGDAFVLARIAKSKGKIVQVVTVDPECVYKGDALQAYLAMNEQAIYTQAFAPSLLNNQDLIVDAILGTGLKGRLRENCLQAITAINAFVDQKSPKIGVFSLDIPSGLQSETGFINPIAIQATRTLTFIALKLGMVTGSARAFCGIIDVDDLDIDTNYQQQFPASAWIDDADALINSLPKRSKIAHKGDHGRLLLIGGDYGFGGAILMSAVAAARSGVGMLTILTRDAHVAPILTQCPEAMIRSITGAEDPSLKEILATVDAVVIGPGLGQGEWGRGILDVVVAADLPLLIDADALNILAGQGKSNDKWVMTPHPGEASRLLGVEISAIEEDRYAAVLLLQKKYSGVIVLKGAGTLIADNNNNITVCNEGNPGMASAGMGDILSGIIGSLLAQGLAENQAARIGVALHARAGDLAAINGQKGLMATDLIQLLRILVNQ